MGMMDVTAMRRLYGSSAPTSGSPSPRCSESSGRGDVRVIIGICLSLLWLVHVSAEPNMPILGRAPGTEVFFSVADFSKRRTYPGLLVLGFDAGLFFVDSDALKDRLRGLAQQADPPRVVVLDFEGVNYIDSQGSQALGEIAAIASHGAELRLARVKPAVLRVLHADGVLQRSARPTSAAPSTRRPRT